MRKLKVFTRLTVHLMRMTLLIGSVLLVTSAILVWDPGETRAGVVAPAWETYAQYEATASYWLDDDTGPPDFAPQDDVDEQEHVY